MSYRYEPGGRPDDVLAASLLLAVAVHAMAILGINFSTPDPDNLNRNLPTLDIMMVPEQRAETPADPDFLANANQPGTADFVQQPPQPELVASRPGNIAAAKSTQTAVLTSRQSSRKEKSRDTRSNTRVPTPSAAQLIEQSLELVSLADQDQQTATSDSAQRKHTFISARTREHKYANYMAAWVAKVERVGNLNYPDAARRKTISGTLLLDVALKSDGSIVDIKLLRSSGQKILDDAAARIVILAAPFAPFPPEIRKETDILHITRTWEFLKTHRLQGG